MILAKTGPKNCKRKFAENASVEKKSSEFLKKVLTPCFRLYILQLFHSQWWFEPEQEFYPERQYMPKGNKNLKLIRVTFSSYFMFCIYVLLQLSEIT